MKNNVESCLGMLLATGIAVSVPSGKAYAQSTMATLDLSFTGVASGGELILGDTLNRNVTHVSIRTNKGELAESIARRLADAINEAVSKDKDFGWWPVSSAGCTLKNLPPVTYVLAGTERGLGIPSPPLSLTCCYDEANNRINVRWTNPPGGYDRMTIILNWHDYDHRSAIGVDGGSTSYVIDLAKRHMDVNDLDVWLVGFRNAVPSNAGAMHMSGKTQEELFGIPFTSGVAPNWTAWSTGDEATGVGCEPGVRERCVFNAGGHYNPAAKAEDKPFFQVIKAGRGNAIGGVWRKFLGLTPGHTYRISARLNSREMEAVQSDWTMSLHTACGAPGDQDLTAEQLAGLAPLPDGSSGPKAGQIALYKPGITTNREFARVSTHDESRPGREIGDITLPAGVDTITVWLRHTGSDSSGVALDWVKLEDVSEQ